MNSVQLLGNLARDPEIRFTKTGRAVAMFTVACTRSYIPAGSSEPRELTDFIPCVAWVIWRKTVAITCPKAAVYSSRAVSPFVLTKRRMVRNAIARKLYATSLPRQWDQNTSRLLRHRMLVHRSPNRLHRGPALTAWVPTQTKKSHSKRSDTPLLILEGGNYT